MKRSRATGPGEVPAPGRDAAAEAATTPPTGPEEAPDTSFRWPSRGPVPVPQADDARPGASAQDDERSGPAPFLQGEGDERSGPAPFLQGEPGARAGSKPFLQPDPGGGSSGPSPFLQPDPGARRPAPFLQPDTDAGSESGGPPRRGGDDHVPDADDAPTAARTAPIPFDEPDPTRPPGGPALGEPTGAPVHGPVPEGPACLDPAEAAARPPAGRRSRLRRRLRYLRRARELMLRDLGGLVYEVHRTGGGDMPAHANLLATKIERLATLDAEAHALEAVLAAPREQIALFEPGVGGTCDACGELYGSDARFCSRCGTPTSGELQAPERAAVASAVSERAPTLAGPASATRPPLPEEPPEKAAPGAEAATSMLPAAGGDQPTQALRPSTSDEEQDAGDDDTRAVRREGLDRPESEDDRTAPLRRGPADTERGDDDRTAALRREPADGERDADEDRTAALRREPAEDDGDDERTPAPGEVLRWRERRR